MTKKPLLISLIFSLAIIWGSVGPAVQPVYADPLSQMTCQPIGSKPISHTDHPTGDKPQSKVWEYNGEWFVVFPATTAGASSAGTWLWKLDANNNWQEVIKLSTRTDTKADVKIVGSVVHTLLFAAGNTQLASVEYVGGTYQLWSQRNTLANITLSGSEIATIDMDSTGRMWLATNSGSNVVAYHSVSPYSTWTGPITVGTGILSSDDIALVTAMPNNTIGVLWSDQSGTFNFGFRVHEDSADPNTWLTQETAATGDMFADDHINVAVASDSTVYVAAKTGDLPGSTPDTLQLLVRRPPATPSGAGTWDAPRKVTDGGTRAIVLLNEVAGVLNFIYPTTTGNGGNMLYKETSTSNIDVSGSAQILRSGDFNDPSSMKNNYNQQLVVVYSDIPNNEIEGSVCRSTVTGPQANLAITKTDNADPVTAGDNVVYTVTVTNNGPDQASSVVVTDNLPGSVNFVSATASQGSCNQASGVVTCNLGNMANAAVATVTITVTTTSSSVPSMSNTASVTSSTTDPVGSNNSATQGTTVNNTPPANADLEVTKTGTTGPINAGDNINYTVAVKNNGPQTAVSVVATDTLPAGVTFVSATPPQGSCSHSSGVVTCNLGSINNGATVSIPIVVTATAGGTLTNNVTVTGNVTDSVSGNNSDSHDTVVVGPTVATFTAVHDAHVVAATNTTNYGNEATLRLRNATSGTNYNAFVKFDVTGLTGSVVNATLKLTVQTVGNNGDNIYAVSNNYLNTSTAWVETGINGSNAPTISGVALDSDAAGTANVTIEYNVTSAITGNGTFSFGIRTNSTSSRYLHSSEATTEAYRPQLVVSTSQNPPEEADITVSPTSLSVGQEPDTQSVQTLTVGNVGDAALTWTVAENNAVSSCSGTSNISWASASPTGGTTAVNDSDNVNVTFNSAGLSDGTHQGTLCVNSNDPDTPTVSVPVTLQVCSPAAALSITNITRSGNTQTVHWSGSATDSFELWWGIDSPYFTPGSDCANSSNCAVVNKNDSSHGHTVNSSSFYNYILIAVNTCGPNVVASENSNRLARFSFDVVPGN